MSATVLGGYASGVGGGYRAVRASGAGAATSRWRVYEPPPDNLIVLTASYKFTSPRNILLCANKSAHTKTSYQIVIFVCVQFCCKTVFFFRVENFLQSISYENSQTAKPLFFVNPIND